LSKKESEVKLDKEAERYKQRVEEEIYKRTSVGSTRLRLKK